jgi:hypothetical protein
MRTSSSRRGVCAQGQSAPCRIACRGHITSRCTCGWAGRATSLRPRGRQCCVRVVGHRQLQVRAWSTSDTLTRHCAQHFNSPPARVRAVTATVAPWTFRIILCLTLNRSSPVARSLSLSLSLSSIIHATLAATPQPRISAKSCAARAHSRRGRQVRPRQVQRAHPRQCPR